MLFGRNIAEIPCFRSSFLYGGGGGIAAGFLSFLMTSRPQFSCHIAMGTFVTTVFAYWTQCRYNYSQEKFFYRQLQPLMKQQAIYEGTNLEKEVQEKAEDA
jgi:cytochrome c oxidase assembly protein subunit 20